MYHSPGYDVTSSIALPNLTAVPTIEEWLFLIRSCYLSSSVPHDSGHVYHRWFIASVQHTGAVPPSEWATASAALVNDLLVCLWWFGRLMWVFVNLGSFWQGACTLPMMDIWAMGCTCTCSVHVVRYMYIIHVCMYVYKMWCGLPVGGIARQKYCFRLFLSSFLPPLSPFPSPSLPPSISLPHSLLSPPPLLHTHTHTGTYITTIGGIQLCTL